MAKRKKNRLPPFVPLTWETLNHEAFISLPHSAARTLPYFLGKVRDTDFKGSGRYLVTFQFSYREAKRYGLSSRTFYRVVRELVAKGFIDVIERGGLRGFGLSYTEFRLSRRWERYGMFDFEERSLDAILSKPALFLANG
jgi:hypothetical protein